MTYSHYQQIVAKAHNRNGHQPKVCQHSSILSDFTLQTVAMLTDPTMPKGDVNRVTVCMEDPTRQPIASTKDVWLLPKICA